MSKPFAMVNFETDSIPEARIFLPFVYETRLIAIQQFRHIDFRQLKIPFL